MMNLKKTPGINGSSMADVSFILFTFFLLVTSMGTDYGLPRQLPPWADDQTSESQIKERNVFEVNVNLHNMIQAEGELIEIGQLHGRVKEFFNVNTVGDNFPEKKDTIIAGINGDNPIRINKTAIFSLQTDRGTSYKTYIQVHNEVAAAIHELRDEFCMQYYEKKYDDCSKNIQKLVGKVYPVAISEAEPKDIKK
ncbi:MAG: biopolymer transporter ExbD [Tannerella sp.]|jgi:biopolymer transport protein ExbD|nr:biopolymer transporter ExbD [Tannerella sp.]